MAPCEPVKLTALASDRDQQICAQVHQKIAIRPQHRLVWKSCGRHVDRLWNRRQSEIYFAADNRKKIRTVARCECAFVSPFA